MAETESPDDSAELEPGMPRWAKAGAIVAVVIMLVLVIGKVAGIEHGPGRHSSDTTKSEPTKSSDAGHKPPVDGHG